MSTFAASDRRSISATGLAIRRGARVLLSELTFAVGPGEALLLRGPNGAGKSSLLLALAGALRPEAGAIVISGGGEEARSETDLHLVGHAAGIKGQLTTAENLRFWAQLYGGRPEAVEAALEEVGLGGLDDLPAGYLSAGQTRRLALARLLVAPRPVWLLDEPLAALDTKGEALVVRLIDGHLAAGGLAIAATHDDIPLQNSATTLVLGDA